MGDKFKDFHYLIEIAVNLDKYIEREKQLSTPSNRGNKTFWENKLKSWICENYHNDGVNKIKEKQFLD